MSNDIPILTEKEQATIDRLRNDHIAAISRAQQIESQLTEARAQVPQLFGRLLGAIEMALGARDLEVKDYAFDVDPDGHVIIARSKAPNLAVVPDAVREAETAALEAVPEDSAAG